VFVLSSPGIRPVVGGFHGTSLAMPESTSTICGIPMIQSILVLGAGSAGLLAALSLKRKLPHLDVRIVRSLSIGTIGVGEGTTPNFPRHLFDTLGIDRAMFYKHAEPTWKIGIRFLWGPRQQFDYHFSKQLDARWSDLSRSNGYYCEDEFRCTDLPAALMAHDKAFPRQPNGLPDIQPWHAFHIENKKLIETLEIVAMQAGVEIIDGTVDGVERGPQGIAALQLKDGRRLEADFFVDASGFRSELLGKALEEPYVSYDKSLFCDRAVVGGWDRTTEPILPYTTAETMNAGWSWKIEHEHHINRGYVYCSQAISDDEAAAEFRGKNPKLPDTLRIVKFRSGRYRRMWVDNVVAIGNSGGFVEPLEATALMVVCAECQAIVETLSESALAPTPTMVDFYNRQLVDTWDEICDFLALHYKINTRLDTPFWQQCRSDTEMSRLNPFMKFYAENGPSGLARYTLPRGTEGNFGVEGWLVMMVGNCAPYRAHHVPAKEERRLWNQRRADFAATAQRGLGVRETLAYVRDPRWKWHASQNAISKGLPRAHSEARQLMEATPGPVRSFALA
jgi:tryptophan halogenase